METIKQFFSFLNDKGIPLPLFRYKGNGSATYTMLLLSFSVCLFGTIGKITKITGEVDMTSAFTLFGICCTLHFGNKINRMNVANKLIKEKKVK